MGAVDLELAIRQQAGSYIADTRLAAPTSQADSFPAAHVPVPLDPGALLALSLDAGSYGRELTAQLFPSGGALLDAWRIARGLADGGPHPLRLRLRLDAGAPALHNLRWETLRDPLSGLALALDARVSLVRSLDSTDTRPVTLAARPELRALLAVASPSDLSRYRLAALDVDGEVGRIRNAVSGMPLTVIGEHSGAAAPRASLAALLAALRREQPALLCLIAHGAHDGDDTALWLEGEEGGAARVSGRALAEAIAQLERPPLLAMLIACESGGDGHGRAGLAALGPQLAQAGLGAVLAMQARLSLDAARRFLPALFAELARDGRIDRAVNLARAALREGSEWWVPALWLRARDGRLWREAPPQSPAAVSLHQLRAAVADFVGRESEAAMLSAALSSGAPAAISGVAGMAGIGKTELAMKVAQALTGHYPDAQLVLNLQGSRGQGLAPEEALRRVIRAFHPGAKLPADPDKLLGLYRSALSGRRVLILADDARDAEQVRPLLPPPGSALLITSRQRFTMPGMRRVDLERLSEQEATLLLRSICDRLTTEEARQITAACGRLPLALRVAGSILANDQTISVAGYLARLADEQRKLGALRDPDDSDLDVTGSLALSYALLDRQAQADLCALGVFAASFELAAAGSVLGEGDRTALQGRLGQLYRRSLVEFVAEQQRYDLHALVRAFALARLGESERSARLRHAACYTRIARVAEKLYRAGGRSIEAGLALFDRERANLDAAWRWLQANAGDPACDRLLIQVTDALAEIGDLRYDKQRAQIQQLEAALEAAARRRLPAAQARFLGNLGNVYASLGDNRRAIELYRRTLELAHASSDRRGESVTLGNLGVAYRNLGEVEQALSCYHRQLAITRDLGDRRGASSALGNLGVAYADQGNMQQAVSCYHQQLIITRELGDRRAEGAALVNLGIAHKRQGQLELAITLYRQALAIARELGHGRGLADASWNLGLALVKQGSVAEALPHLTAGRNFYRRLGHPRAAEMERFVAALPRAAD